jgi:hypothetical protein
MAIEITWKITRLEIINKDGLQNVAIQSCFDVEGVDENDKRGFVQGDVMLLPPSDPAKFIDVNNITEAEAIAWTKKALPNNGVDFEDRVKEQIGWQYEEKPKTADLPWITPESNQSQDEE